MLTEREETALPELMYEIAVVQDTDGNTALHHTTLRMVELALHSQEATLQFFETSRKSLLLCQFMTDTFCANKNGQTAEDILLQSRSVVQRNGLNFDVWRELTIVCHAIRLRYDELNVLRNHSICSNGVAYITENVEELSQLTPIIIVAMKERFRKFALKLLVDEIRRIGAASGVCLSDAIRTPDLAESVTRSLGLSETDILGSTAIQIAHAEGYHDIERLLTCISHASHKQKS